VVRIYLYTFETASPKRNIRTSSLHHTGTLLFQRYNVHRAGCLLVALMFLAACGGGGSSTPSTGGNGGGGGGGGGTGGGGGAANPPVSVTVTAGAISSGVDITVPAPASVTAPNASLLGAAVVPPGGGDVSITLTNGSSTVHQGSPIIVALAGTGIAATGTTVTISGPDDITIDTTTVKDITLDGGQKGLTFQAAVASGAALGARTVLLKNAQNDITSFTGGLQVIQ
jgi:hypothetical protein